MEQNIDTSDRTGLVEDEYYVEKIVDKRLDKHVVLYGVKWQDYPEEDNTEENLDNLFNSLETVKEYEKNRLAKVRFQNPNYDLNHRDRNKLPVDRCPLYVQEMKNTLLDEINKGDVCIFQVLGMTTVKNKRNFFIEFNNKKVAMITDEEVEVRESDFWFVNKS